MNLIDSVHEPALERGIHAASASLLCRMLKRHECRAPVHGLNPFLKEKQGFA